MEKKADIKVNGTNFHIESIKAMSREQFVKRYEPITNVMPNEDAKKRSELLGKAYDEITK